MKLLPTDDLAKAKIELAPYLLDAFGSYERIDYGTGHELNFFVFLFCIFRIGIFKKEDFEGMALRVF